MALTGAALVASPRVARATGGLDVTATPEAQHQVRVLLASGAFPEPQALDAWHFSWNGRTYRGTFDIIALPDGRRGLVNSLPLDAYLSGVLSKEVSAVWAAGAQQAQAIVSRTYALLKLRPEKPYDVVASESDQVYGGIEGETVEGRAAVDATAGSILVYAGRPAHVAYSACCGGRTADAGDVWGAPYPYLPSIVDPNCIGTPAYNWSATVALDAVAAAFGSAFTDIGPLRSVRIESDDPSDRPRNIAFVGSTSSFETSPKAFRASLGPSVVRSAFLHTLTLADGGASLAVWGTGRGHGVGMCQWGAREMGERGASARDIVDFYFPGTSFGVG